MAGHPVEHILKCRALGDIVMSPAKAKDRFALVAVMNPPEIVEAAFLQWITFKIEEQIGGVRRRQCCESAPVLHIELLDPRCPAAPPRELARSLPAPLCPSCGRHAGHPRHVRPCTPARASSGYRVTEFPRQRARDGDIEEKS